MKKQLNVELIQNELRGGSAFFPGYKGRGASATSNEVPQRSSSQGTPVIQIPEEKKQQPQQTTPVRPYESTSVRPSERPDQATRRRLIRHPFEFYEDQVEQLRRRALEAQLRGEKLSMSEMAREALDDYLEKVKRTPVR